MNTLLALSLTFTLLVFGQQQSGQQSSGQQQGTIMDVVRQCQDCSKSFDWFQKHPEFLQSLKDVKQFTVFVPNNVAFDSSRQQIEQMPQDQLIQLIKSHIVPQSLPQLQEGKLTTLSGSTLNIKKQGDKFMINDAHIIGDFRRSDDGNGYYLIDKVLTSNQQSGQQQSGQQQPSGQQQQSGQQSGTVETQQFQAGPQRSGPQDIWKMLQSMPEVSKFLELVNQNQDFKQQLDSNQQPFTLLIPNNDAFNSITDILQRIDENTLKKFLMYHVISRQVNELKDGESYPTLLQNEMISVKKQGDKFTLTPQSQQQTQKKRQQQEQQQDVHIVGNYHPAKDQKGFYIIDQVLIPTTLKQQIDQLRQHLTNRGNQ